MRVWREKNAVTLIEMLVVIGIIAMLATLVLSLTGRLESRTNQKLTQNTIAIVDTALGEFADYGFEFKHDDYDWMKFPPDCNNFSSTNFTDTIETALGLGFDNVKIDAWDDGDPNCLRSSGIVVMYFILNQVPQCRKILSRIDSSLLVSRYEGSDPYIRVEFAGDSNSKIYSLLRINDAWGQPLRYDYYNERLNLLLWEKSRKTFPVITSAGPDKKFDTSDDITSQ